MTQRPMTKEERATTMATFQLAIVAEALRLGGTVREGDLPAFAQAADRVSDDKDLLFGSSIDVAFNIPVWGGECHVYIRLRKTEVTSPFGIGATTKISWSSTERNVPTALTAVGLYHKAIELAAFVEALMPIR